MDKEVKFLMFDADGEPVIKVVKSPEPFYEKQYKYWVEIEKLESSSLNIKA